MIEAIISGQFIIKPCTGSSGRVVVVACVALRHGEAACNRRPASLASPWHQLGPARSARRTTTLSGGVMSGSTRFVAGLGIAIACLAGHASADVKIAFI